MRNDIIKSIAHYENRIDAIRNLPANGGVIDGFSPVLAGVQLYEETGDIFASLDLPKRGGSGNLNS